MLQSRAFTVVIIAAIVFLGISMWGRYEEYKRIKKEVSALEQKKENFKEKQNRGVSINERYLERQARIELNYKSPGEKVVYIYRNIQDGNSSASAGHGRTGNPNKSNFQLWLEYVFGIK